MLRLKCLFQEIISMNLWFRGEPWAGDIWKALAIKSMKLDEVIKVMWVMTGEIKDSFKSTINNHVFLPLTSLTHLSSASFQFPGLSRYCPPQFKWIMNRLFRFNPILNQVPHLTLPLPVSGRHDQVSLAALFIYWETMGKLIVSPCCHSHNNSTHMFKFFLPFFSGNFGSGFLFYGHTTALKKNTNKLAERFFPMNIKNILWLSILTIQFTFVATSPFQSVLLLILLGDCHSLFLWTHYSECSLFSDCWLLQSSTSISIWRFFLNLANFESIFCTNPIIWVENF